MPADQPIPLVGGPLDGHHVRKVAGRVVWVRGLARTLQTTEATKPWPWREGAGGQAHPGDGRALYMLGQGAQGDLAYLYAGHRRYLCGACGAYHDKVEGGSERPPCALGATA